MNTRAPATAMPGILAKLADAGRLEQLLRDSGALGSGRWAGGRQEVAFYSHLAPQTPADMVPRCHQAHWDQAANSWHILLDDLDPSHEVATRWPLPPDVSWCEAIVCSLARFHAHWWNHPGLGRDIGEWPGLDIVGHAPARLQSMCEKFVDAMGDALSATQRELFERLARSSDVLAAQSSRESLTIVHGDAHMWNVFVPRSGTSGGPLWFDWDSWRIDLGAGDLAYMLAMYWFPGQRQVHESRMLDAYHAALVDHGVRRYSRAQLAGDYRLCVLQQLAVPLNQWTLGVPPVLWWNNLQRLLMAAEDLECRELLAPQLSGT